MVKKVQPGTQQTSSMNIQLINQKDQTHDLIDRSLSKVRKDKVKPAESA